MTDKDKKDLMYQRIWDKLYTWHQSPNAAGFRLTKLADGILPDDAVTLRQLNGLPTPVNYITSVGNTSNINLAVTGAQLTAQLTATGVTAGTYGDASNVSQITVDAYGRIISAVDVAIGGGGGGITSLNGLVAGVQTFSKVDDTNVTLTITSAVANHAFAMGWTGTLADARITSSANWNTAYTNRITSLTTIGSSGVATLVANTLNIPNYSIAGLSPLTTKGDVFTYSTVNTRLGIGADATLFMADAAATTGNKWIAFSGDATVALTGALTLATVNANVGTFGSATKTVTVTANAKGLITAISEQTISITGLGTALTKTDDTNVTLTLGGSPTTALVNAASLTLGWTGQLALSRGGTNANLTAVNGGVVYSTATAMAITAAGTAGYVLMANGAAAPTWAAPATVFTSIFYWAQGVGATLNPADSTNYHFGLADATPATTTANRRFKFVNAGSVVTAQLTYLQANNGSNETVTIYLRNVTTATDTSIGTFTSDFGATTSATFNFTGLAITVNNSDYYCIKIACPAWATNPSGWAMTCLLITQ